MSNNTNNTVKSAQDIVNQLKSFRGTDVTINARSIWVKAPQTGKKADALKGMGFKYAASKGAWWYTYNATPAPTQKAPAKQEKTAKPKAEKAQAPKAQAELTAEQFALMDKYARMFPSTQVSVDRTWVWLKCSKEFGKEHADALKAEGFWFSAKREAWYRTPEHAQMAQAKTAPKAEPKPVKQVAQKAPKTTKKTALKGGIVSMAQMLG